MQVEPQPHVDASAIAWALDQCPAVAMQVVQSGCATGTFSISSIAVHGWIRVPHGACVVHRVSRRRSSAMRMSLRESRCQTPEIGPAAIHALGMVAGTAIASSQTVPTPGSTPEGPMPRPQRENHPDGTAVKNREIVHD